MQKDKVRNHIFKILVILKKINFELFLKNRIIVFNCLNLTISFLIIINL